MLLVGLDCAEPSLVFDRWPNLLPRLSALRHQGLYGPLTSTIPPITVPAWTAMLTSKDPGQLGLYGFRNRRAHDYAPLSVANAASVKEPTLHQLLSRQRRTSVLIGVPQTYPPRPLRGLMVSGFLTPNKDADYTYPPDLKPELDGLAGGEYILDVDEFRTEDKDRLLARIQAMTAARFNVAEHLLQREPWDFFMVVEIGLDRMHHGFWRFHDPAHRLYEPGNRFETTIRDYYVDLDRRIGRLVDLAPEGTLVLVVSDHGARTMVGGVALNQWLIEQGYLALKEMPSRPERLTMDRVDWPRTRAWGEGGYYGRVFLNVAGREPQGRVRPEEMEPLRRELMERLEKLPDDQGRPMGTRVFRPEDIYRAVKNAPPDLIVYFGDLAWRSVGTVGAGQPIHVFENDMGPDDANHAQQGMLVMALKDGRWKTPGGRREGMTLYDVAPTVLTHLGLPVPGDMIGHALI